MYVHRALSCHCRQQVWLSTLFLSRRLDQFDARFAQNAEVPFNTETKKARLPTDSCLNNSMRPNLVNCISTNPECRSDHRWLVYNYSLVLNYLKRLLSLSSRVHGLFRKFSPRRAVSQCSQNFALHLALSLLLAIAVMIRLS